MNKRITKPRPTYAARLAAKRAKRLNPTPQAVAARKRAQARRIEAQHIITARVFAADAKETN